MLKTHIQTSFAAVVGAFKTRPSPDDVASVIKNTKVGVLATVLNVLIYAWATFETYFQSFTAIWVASTLVVCLLVLRKSERASGKVITHVSRRAARRLAQTSFVLALPWAALAFYTIGLDGVGEPVVVVMVCVGMLTGGAFMLQRTFIASLFYTWLIFLSLILSAHLGGWAHAWSVTGYSVVYGVFLAYIAFLAGEALRARDRSLAALSDAVQELRKARDDNYRLANIDDTTGLLNRKAFDAALQDAVSRTADTQFTLMIMDLDRFKNVNDLFGHGVGDELLREIAQRLKDTVGTANSVARLGGDEFAIICEDELPFENTRELVAALIARINEPVFVSGRLIHTGASVGAAHYPKDGASPLDLMSRADLALNHAKESGRGRFARFDASLREKIVASDRIEDGLRSALSEDRLFMKYQPKIDLSNGQTVGAEALVRLREQDGSYVSVESFLKVAAERGILPSLSKKIAEMIGDDILLWREVGIPPIAISMNIHPDDLKAPEILMENIDALESRGVTNRDISLEVTEGCFIGRGTDKAIFTLDTLAERGYEISLDDFGTGHASLSHLKSIPVSELKIDRSFVIGLEKNQNDRAIIAAISELSSQMGLRSVAEGVETEGQRKIIEHLGIDLGQGYYWSKPLDRDELLSFQQNQTANYRHIS